MLLKVLKRIQLLEHGIEKPNFTTTETNEIDPNYI